MTENKDWIKRIRKLMKNIKKFELGDRIQTISQLIYMHNALYNSVKGWNNWFNMWVASALNEKMGLEDDIVNLTEEELKELHEKLRKMIPEFLNLDIKMTKIIDKRSKEEIKTKTSTEIAEAIKGIVV